MLLFRGFREIRVGRENREILGVRLTGRIRNNRELRDIWGAGIKKSVYVKMIILLLPNVTYKQEDDKVKKIFVEGFSKSFEYKNDQFRARFSSVNQLSILPY